jgi:DUF1365 family protein
VRKSALFEGLVLHRRLGPKKHEFRHRIFLLYLDLEELPHVFDGHWLWSSSRRNLVWFRRADYLGPASSNLREAVLDRVQAEIGRRPAGPVRILTHLRSFGYVFNPVTFYYCFDRNEGLEAVVAEITNTPWGERHTYVLDGRETDGGTDLCSRFRKDFHVSPFFGMDLEYEWRVSAPSEHLRIHMTNLDGGRPVFHAGFEGRRREITARSLAGVLVRYPFLTLRLHAAIYWQAARLFWKRVPFHVHPRKLSSNLPARTT